MKYKIKCLQHTSQIEENFDYAYHEKYIGKIGDYIEHNYKSGKFIDAICLYTDYDEDGKPSDGNWFHKDDLELIDEK